ncbi:MAG: M20/M25/M40 family metallo-hydrolase [Acidimicrobiales bacterium]|nr:M20/M25/M40 family metallo-hydrolase [Acidimicrobiales bacterium]
MGDEVADLLGVLIRNRCVSRFEGISSIGNESVNAATLRAVVEGPGVDVDWYEAIEGRASLVARISGSDPTAPSLALMGHTDVVPADDADGWSRDPFGGELVDGEVWGRGAVDMLNQTAAMALTVRRLADEGFRPRGDLVFWAVPDEENGGYLGAKQVIESDHDLIRTDFALTEVGGAARRTADGLVVDASVSDKGMGVVHLAFRGRQSHASLPHGADNPLLKAAEAVRRIDAWRPAVRISDPWRRWVDAQGFDAGLAAALIDPNRIDEVLDLLPVGMAAHAHACTRCTAVPTIIKGGDKINTIPQTVELAVNFRPALGDSADSMAQEFRDLLSDLVDDDGIFAIHQDATASPTDTPLWEVLASVTDQAHEGAVLVPAMLAAWTDASWLRPAGTTTYGFGLLSEKLPPSEYWARFHGVDERIDIESLDLSATGWYEVARQFLT